MLVAALVGLGCSSSSPRPSVDETIPGGDAGVGRDATTSPGSDQGAGGGGGGTGAGGGTGGNTAGGTGGGTGGGAGGGTSDGTGVGAGGSGAGSGTGSGDLSIDAMVAIQLDAAGVEAIIASLYDANGGPDCTALLQCCATLPSDSQAGCIQLAQLNVDSFCQQAVAGYQDAGVCR
jgi:hypothetical protein